jgi:hypothetical protein
MGAALLALTTSEVESWAGREFVPGPKGVLSSKQHYKAADQRAGE